MEAFTVFLHNNGKDIKKSILKLDAYNYYMMNVIDYLVGNTDRHWGNWGVLVDNSSNKAKGLHKLMDFNQAFHCYDNPEGGKLSDGILFRYDTEGSSCGGCGESRAEPDTRGGAGDIFELAAIL